MPDHAHDVRLLPVLVLGIAHGLAVDRQTGVVLSIGFVPLLTRLVERHGIDADQDVTNDELTRHAVNALLATTAEALACFRCEVFGPPGDGASLARDAGR